MILAACGFGVAALTKGVGPLFCVACIIPVVAFPELKWRQKAGFIALILMAVTLCSAPFYARLLQISSSPAKAMAMGGDLAAERFGIAELVSSASKNLAMEISLPFDGWNSGVEKGVARLHQWIGVPLKDPQLATGHDFDIVYEIDEDVASNPLHMFLIIFTGVGFFFIRKKTRQAWFLWTALILGALLFCITVKWQPWITRFHVSFFLLAAPLVVIVLERSCSRKVLIFLFGLLFLASLHPLTLNNTRRIFPEKSMFLYTREQLYFSRWRSAVMMYQTILRDIRAAGCSSVGIIMGGDSWEYPFWALSDGKTRFEHINVATGAEKFEYPSGAFMPCAVIKEAPQEEAVFIYQKQPFFRILKGYWTAYIRFDHMPTDFQAEALRQMKGK